MSGADSEATAKPTRPFSAKRIKELTTAVCQHGLAIPEGYTFDPRGNPPLFPTPAPAVAIKLQNDGYRETDETGIRPDCSRCDGGCTGACDPAGDDPEGSAP